MNKITQMITYVLKNTKSESDSPSYMFMASLFYLIVLSMPFYISLKSYKDAYHTIQKILGIILIVITGTFGLCWLYLLGFSIYLMLQ